MSEPIPVFRGRVDEHGKLLLEASEATRRAQHLVRLAGKSVDVVVKVHRDKRSNQQNKWEWKIAIPTIAEGLGWDMHDHERLHYTLVDLCFGRTFNEKLGTEVPNVRSSRLNTKQFSEYMEWLVRWAAVEHGIVVPLPSEAESEA